MRVADQIIDDIRENIGSGVYPPGSRLPTEAALAEHYQVSGPTVRESIRALAAMGLVEVRHGSGTYVTANFRGLLSDPLRLLVSLDGVGIDELLGLLQVLERYAGTLAVERATEQEIAELGEAARAVEASESLDELNAATVEFTHRLTAGAHHPLLDELCAFLVSSLVELETSSYRHDAPKFWRAWVRERSALRFEIANALEARDPVRLTQAIDDLHEGVSKAVGRIPALREARIRRDPS